MRQTRSTKSLWRSLRTKVTAVVKFAKPVHPAKDSQGGVVSYDTIRTVNSVPELSELEGEVSELEAVENSEA